MTTALCLWQAASAHAFLARADEIQATTHYQYSPTGQRTSQTSPEGRQTQYSYDSLGRLSQVTDAQGNTTGYQYNSQGQLLAQTDAEGKTTQYGYDRAGRRVQRTLADGASETLHYNALGQLTQKTHFDGSQTTWEYGAAASGNIPNPAWGQITREHRADGSSQSRSYDGHGRHTQSADTRDGTETRSLDALGRVTSSTIQHSAAQLSGSSAYQSRQNYQWDARGLRTQLHAPASGNSPEHRISASWDAAGQLQSLQASSDAAANQFTHDGAGRLTQITRSDGSSTSYQYTPDGHISQIRHQGSQGQTLAQFDYQHNRDGQRTQAKETIHSNGQTLQRTIDWTYDPAGKLTQEHIQQTQPTAQTLTIAYQYDKVGNRTARTVSGAIQQTTTYQYDQNDRLTQSSDSIEGTTSYRYDRKGNLVEKANGNNKTAYSWNSDNRLIKVEHTGQNNKTIQYGYDPQGRRIKKLVTQGTSKTETHYSLDSERPYHEVVVESTRVNTQPWTHKTYVHTPGGVGELISQSDGATTKQIYADAQGTTRLIADGTTGTSQSYSFDAFGNALEGDSLAADQNPPTHLYTGERYDADTGLIYLRARDYDPATGRFISMDEHPGDQRIPLTLNKYLYANADPVNFIDPSGYMTMVAGVGMGNFSVASISIANYSFVAAKILVPIVMVAGMDAVINTGFLSQALPKERNKLKNKINNKALALGVALSQVLFHYTDDLIAVKSIVADSALIATSDFIHSDGKLRPEGAYATKLPPYSSTMTRDQLARILFDNRRGWSVGFFVAFAQTPDWVPLIGAEWYRPAPAGELVPILPIMYGPNLMR
ncbi:RHS repeat-associated core domain-containing protein [Vandammella animalimorsus]|uniref:RHS repeat-associated core domain-containing protein n=1 Tax=Vandammella animalimorsus TaxID=2029117 RepID=UPI00325B6CA6